MIQLKKNERWRYTTTLLVARNVFKEYKNQTRHNKVNRMFEEVRPEMRALIYFMVGMTLLAIGLLLSQADFAIAFLTNSTG